MMGRLHGSHDRPRGSKQQIFWRTVGLFRPFRYAFAALFFLIVATSTLSLAPALLIARIVSEVTPNTAGVIPGSARSVTTLFTVILALYVSSGVLDVLLGYINQTIGQGVMFNVRAALHAHIQRLPVRFFTATRTGEILSRIITDVNTMQQAVTATFTDFLTNLVTLVVALGFMFTLEWRLALLALVVLPIWVYPTLRVGNAQRRLMRAWQEEAAEMSAHLEETLSISGSMLVKTFGRQVHESSRFLASNDHLRRLSIQRMMAGRWFNMATDLFGAISVAVVYWLGGMFVLGGDVGIGEVVAFAYLSQRVFTPFRQIARINTTLLSSLALFERVFEYLDLPVEVDERPDAVRLERPRGAIAFADVRFAYTPRGRPAIDGVSFEIAAGAMVALVGPSGAGKTTVTYLMQRFYDPQSGAVRLDGHDLRDLTLGSVSRAVGTVMQDTYLFHTTLLDNIRYGRLDATDDEVRASAHAAGLDSMIERLPDGLDTVVGERGYRLSGGEKQRVAIARAILKDPPILILDEATSSLDSRLEREIREATATLAAGRTTVVIAHRLSTVVAADVILVFDRGRVVERGTHAELLARAGLYASLYREQFTELAPAGPRANGDPDAGAPAGRAGERAGR